MEILRTIVLIGVTKNEYIEEVLSSSINVFSLLLIPDKYIPEFTGRIFLPRLKTNEEFTRSGYSEGTTTYLFLIIVI